MPIFLSLFFLTLLTAIVFFLQFVAPGLLLARVTLGKYYRFTALEHLTLGIFLSLSLQALVLFVLGTAIGTKAYGIMYLFLAIGLVALPTSWKVLTKITQEIRTHWLLAGVGTLAIFSLASTLLFTWIITPDSFFLQRGQLHDSAWHIALINNLQQTIPPRTSFDVYLRSK